MFNKLLRDKIADTTEFVTFPGYTRRFDPVLEQYVMNGLR